MTGPGRYRRRAQPIEAMRFTGDNAEEVIAWCGGSLDAQQHLHLDGSIHSAQPGDYILREDIPGDGYRYFPMPSAMFEHSYEEVS